MFKAVNGLLPLRFSNLFINNNGIHNPYTRQNCNLYVLRYITEFELQILKSLE